MHLVRGNLEKGLGTDCSGFYNEGCKHVVVGSPT